MSQAHPIPVRSSNTSWCSWLAWAIAILCGFVVCDVSAAQANESVSNPMSQAYAYFHVRDYEQAREKVEAYLQHASSEAIPVYQEARAWNALGVIYAVLGNAEKSERSFKQAADLLDLQPELRPLLSEVLTNLGNLYYRTGRPEMAWAILSRAEGVEEQLEGETEEVESYLGTNELEPSFLGPLTMAQELDQLIIETIHDLRRPEVLLFAEEGIRSLQRHGVLEDPSVEYLVHNFAGGMTIRPHEAEATYRQAVLLAQQQDDSLAALESQFEIANLHIENGNFVAARDELQRLIRESGDLRQARGLNDALAQFTLNLNFTLAEVLEAQRDVAAAKTALSKDYEDLLQAVKDSDYQRASKQVTLELFARLALSESDIVKSRQLLHQAEELYLAPFKKLGLKQNGLPLDILLLRARIAAASNEPIAAAAELKAATQAIQKTPSWSRDANEVSLLLAHVVDLANRFSSNDAVQQVAALSMLAFFSEVKASSDPPLPIRAIGDATLLKQINAYRGSRVAVATSLLQPAMKATKLLRLAHDLAAARKDLDDALSKLPTDPREDVTLERVREVMPEGGCLIAYLRVADNALKLPRLELEYAPGLAYYGLSQCKNSKPQIVRLAEAKDVESAISRYRDAMKVAQADKISEQRDALAAVSKLVLKPFFANKNFHPKALVVLPGAEVNFVSFAALLTPTGKFLIEQWPVSYISTPTDFLPRQEVSARSPGVVIGDPDYGPQSPTAGKGEQDAKRFSSQGVGSWYDLPQTHREAETIAKLVGTQGVYLGAAATADRVLEVHGPKYLHIATHGYFIDQGRQERSIELPRARSREDLLAMLRIESLKQDPLFYSGLVFAGANDDERKVGGSVSRLTALHIANLDLQGTRLTSLSACESGLGTPGEFVGLQGMRTALSSAGSSTQLLSLWRVHTETSKATMVEFYARLSCGVSEAEALRQAQNAARHIGGQEVPPFYWSAYTLSGDVEATYSANRSGDVSHCVATRLAEAKRE